MKRVPLAEFEAHCSKYIEELGREEIVITQDGEPVARVMPEVKKDPDPWRFLGVLEGRVYVDPHDDLLSTGRKWDARP
jgi:prevent-host-death family protein